MLTSGHDGFDDSNALEQPLVSRKSRGEETQVNTLIYTMGENADDIFHSFDLSDEDKKKYKTVKNKFDSHFVKRKNIIYERAVFNRRKQEESESIDTFITALYTPSEHCNYGALKDSGDDL